MGLKDYLENLEIGENKVKLSKEDIKGILAESGKIVTTETDKIKEEYKTTIEDLKKQVENAPNSEEMEILKNKIADYEQKETERIEEEKAKARDEILNNNINEVIGEKKFINDYTKNAIVNELKSALNDEANTGKSIKDLFENITKDHNDIFMNEQQFQDMPGMGDSEQISGVKEMPQIW